MPLKVRVQFSQTNNNHLKFRTHAFDMINLILNFLNSPNVTYRAVSSSGNGNVTHDFKFTKNKQQTSEL